MIEAYKGKKVLVTGHTGFKGSWLCEILLRAKAKVYGFALEPPTTPAFFNDLDLGKRLVSHHIGDIRDVGELTSAVASADPDYIFHLAAQPIVRESYVIPRETFDTNVMGTVNLLEAVRLACASGKRTKPLRVVCVTTDKVYENNNSGIAFKEDDPLGGSDPYSASKGAAEIAIASYARSFFADSAVTVASARAGNVIGGGDWAPDRIVPDIIRAYESCKPLMIRNHNSTRPWQHVLEPLAGYLMLGLSGKTGAYNFGPDMRQVKTVGTLVKEFQNHLHDLKTEDCTDPSAPAEAKLLRLDSRKAKRELDWVPRWNFKTTVAMTAQWYERVLQGEAAKNVTREQIDDYFGV